MLGDTVATSVGQQKKIWLIPAWEKKDTELAATKQKLF